MPSEIGGVFNKRNLTLTSGGVYEFDAVSEDSNIVGSVYTGNLLTSGGNQGAGEKQKVLSDIYFLLLVDARRKLILLTDHKMTEYWTNQQIAGRVPDEIEIVLVGLPSDLRSILDAAIEMASQEVRPSSSRVSFS